MLADDNYYSQYTHTNNIRKYQPGYEIDPSKSFIGSYLSLRKSLGIMGILLPVILIVGTFLFGGNFILPSISDYFYSPLRTAFTGIIFLIGIFLWYYKSEDNIEWILTKIASISVFLVSVLPTSILSEYSVVDGKYYTIVDFKKFVTPSIQVPIFVKYSHYLSASIFFVCLIVLVLCFFVKSEKKGQNLKYRIIIYRLCGWGMLLCISSIILFPKIFDSCSQWVFPTTFMLETISLTLFGISWLIKGEVDEYILAHIQK